MKHITFQKIALIQICTMAAATSWAETPAMANNKLHWYYSVTGLYQQPSDAQQYAYQAGPPAEDKSTPITPVNGEFAPAIGLSLGYFYNPTDDISIHYLHADFNDSHSSSSSVESTEDVFFNFAKIRFTKHYNALTIKLGRLFNTDNWNTHLFGGLDYTSVIEHFSFNGSYAQFEDISVNYQVPKVSYSNSDFHGIGPQIGFESSYKLRNNFNLVGGADLSLLAAKFSYYSNSHGGAARPGTAYKNNNAAIKVQANLGVSYEKVIQNNYLMTIELGYKALYLQSQAAAPDGGENGRIAGDHHYNFSMSGPYLGIKVSL